jgi:PhzF family phenazine biosynthesis protein
MSTVNVLHYDAFSSTPNKGNPAGIVLNADHLNTEDMQRIAAEVGFNETVFVFRSQKSDIKLKYFTPGHEMNLCGHATIGAIYCLHTRGLLAKRETIEIETNAGILPVAMDAKSDPLSIKMKQDRPRFTTFQGDAERLAASIGLTKADLDVTKPIVYVSTGTWTLLVPVKKLAKFQEMQPRNQMFPDVLCENPKSSVHPICFETYDQDAFMHARHFSSPYSGTIEDPVTGTASGVMGAYYLTYVHRELPSASFTVEQGQEMGRDGRVQVQGIRNNVHHDGQADQMDIFISGTAVFVREFDVEYK